MPSKSAYPGYDDSLFDETGFPFVSKEAEFFNREDIKDRVAYYKPDHYLKLSQEVYDAFTAKYNLEPDEAEVYEELNNPYQLARVRKRTDTKQYDPYLMTLARITQYWTKDDISFFTEIPYKERMEIWDVIEKAQNTLYG